MGDPGFTPRDVAHLLNEPGAEGHCVMRLIDEVEPDAPLLQYWNSASVDEKVRAFAERLLEILAKFGQGKELPVARAEDGEAMLTVSQLNLQSAIHDLDVLVGPDVVDW